MFTTILSREPEERLGRCPPQLDGASHPRPSTMHSMCQQDSARSASPPASEGTVGWSLESPSALLLVSGCTQAPANLGLCLWQRKPVPPGKLFREPRLFPSSHVPPTSPFQLYCRWLVAGADPALGTVASEAWSRNGLSSTCQPLCILKEFRPVFYFPCLASLLLKSHLFSAPASVSSQAGPGGVWDLTPCQSCGKPAIGCWSLAGLSHLAQLLFECPPPQLGQTPGTTPFPAPESPFEDGGSSPSSHFPKEPAGARPSKVSGYQTPIEMDGT
ncbi:hypothetical protein KIL84_011515 [Mauremys mutica]|uniref:Uncharacterized protein n=1 Tax=Mauremys mutica TaxID=74926 RepID=A0A9D3XDH7_9SAUR|nr:hypothetical protein KIL84_011515 [Mauremys mutica]